MNIINDFSFLSWKGEVFSSEPFVDVEHYSGLLERGKDIFCDYLTIVLAISQQNFDRFLALNETKKALGFFSDSYEEIWGHAEVFAVQYKIVSFLIHTGDLTLNKAIGQRLETMRKGRVIGYDTSRKLISLLTLIREKRTTEVESVQKHSDSIEGSYYEDRVEKIRSQIAVLEHNIEDPRLKKRLEHLVEKLENQTFSIGITGVMNAGKSTMLNALMGQEVLGTSVIPETANLTIIKQGKVPKAVVNFWRASEWEDIAKSADTLESMRSFVDETQEHFGDEIGMYITPTGRNITIPVDELPAYTSAQHSDKKCNLVKSVELYSDLEFVRNGVEIVDTPGLDDPVIQREEITREYLLDCDLMCHLMNVGQSATQKDIAFILDTLLYHNVAQLLIVITRIDRVTSEELEEVIAYTRSSIRKQLESLGKRAQTDALLQKIRFIPIAGKMALMHRTGQGAEADRLGYDLARSGILEVEAYLREVLFSSSSPKTKLILESANKELLHILHAQIESYSEEKEMLGKSAEEITRQYEQYQVEISQTTSHLESLFRRLETSAEELRTYFAVLDKGVEGKLQALQSVLKRRIMDDVFYTLRREKKKPTHERTATIIETAIRDGFIDLLRDYRYQFGRRMEESMERIQRDFDAFLVSNDDTVEDTGAFFEQHFSGMHLTHSTTVLTEQIHRAIATHGAKQLEALEGVVDGFLGAFMQKLHESFRQKVSSIQEALLSDFHVRSHEPLERIKEGISNKKKRFEEARDRAESGSFDVARREAEISAKLQIVQQIQAEVSAGGAS